MSKVSLTTPTQAAVAVVAGASSAGLGLLLCEYFDFSVPVVPWTLPALMFTSAAFAIWYALNLPKRREERKLSAKEGFYALVIGKAMIITGALIAGSHGVYIMKFVPLISADLPKQRVILGAATILVSLIFAFSGWLIEKRLILQDPPDSGDEGQTQGVVG